MINKALLFVSFFSLLIIGCSKDNSVDQPAVGMQLSALRIGTHDILNNEIDDADPTKPLIISFSHALNKESVAQSVFLETAEGQSVSLTFNYLDGDKTISAKPAEDLSQNSSYKIFITEEIKGTSDEFFTGVERSFTTLNPPFKVEKVFIEDELIDTKKRILDINESPKVLVKFSKNVVTDDFSSKVFLQSQDGAAFPQTSQAGDSTILFNFTGLSSYQKHTLYFPPSIMSESKNLETFSFSFYTKLDSTLKFPEISDEELLTKVQEQTFKYFYDFAHPTSGLNRERNTSNDNVTIGGSGFGVMAIIVGVERGFITKQEGIDRLEKITEFLENKADRFHGVWSHWLSGTSGKANPFSADDDGGDLVETAFMIQGLITVRQYLDESVSEEKTIIDRINRLVDEVEWDWYQQGGQDQLYWHWSPNFGWQKNHSIRGWNEALIVYVLAASSNTHAIDKQVYDNGWAQNGNMQNSNNRMFYDMTLPLRSDRGGPLFFSHYSFLGLDPRNLSDQYANYWEQNRIHTLINRAYCIENPKNALAFSNYSWGLTASDGDSGYSAHSPDNDRGVITPTAALSSMPYTPSESMEALRFFYYILGDKLWGEYGFYDAFNATEGWYADSYLAIDQGPIVCMIENHRTGLLWDLFMSAPEVKNGLDKLGFTY